MILAFDTYYFENKAKTVCIEFKEWEDDKFYKIHTEIIENIEGYTSGEFYKRELPCILSLLNKISITKVETIIIDGFVYLNDELKFGLGAFLHQKLNGKISIIGVAKTNFKTIEKNKIELFRGKSIKPIYITSVGMELNKASEKIKSMHGEYRIPSLLKELDIATKDKNNG